MPLDPQIQNRQIALDKPSSDEEIFVEAKPPEETPTKAPILLIHGFPESSHQFRHVIPLLCRAGYRIIAPDYRDYGFSCRPIATTSDFTKRVLATDFHTLLTTHLGIHESVDVVGHDIGGMIAHAYAAQHPDAVASVIWGECPLPGSSVYDATKYSTNLWHFDF